jgi:long-chain acyl-CoA synthetase
VPRPRRVAPIQLVTAEQAEQLAARAAGSLLRRGLRPGDRVVTVAGNSVDYLCVLFGAVRAGLVPVPLPPTLTAPELDPLIDDAEPAVVLRSPELAELLAGPPAELARWPRCRPMHYTSGTSGQPKGVWSGLFAEPEAASAVADERDLWRFTGGDRHLVCSGLYHSAPLRFAIGTLLAGGAVVVPPRFAADTFRSAVVEHRPTTAFLAPAQLQRIAAAGDPPGLDSFRLLAHAGAPCPDGLKRWALERFPEGAVWEFYGSTEGQFTACSPAEWLARPGTVGRARPGRVLRVDRLGRVWCRPPAHARFSYWRDPEKTRAAWDGDWFTVGDLGSLDGDGYLYLDGHRDDLIISGGVNVYPVEVERAIAAAEGVVDVAVFGVADEQWGQRVCAAVVGDVAFDRLRSELADRLAPHKLPKTWLRVAELPRTPTGKLRRSTMARDLGLDVPVRDADGPRRLPPPGPAPATAQFSRMKDSPPQ